MKVLIVGAGPTGSMMACQLALLKIPFRIIDKSSGPAPESRALLLQARSLEIFDQMGLAEKAIKAGTIVHAFGVIWKGKKLGKLLLKDVGKGLTKFPYFLILEQSHTEELMISFLKERGVEVDRQTELIGFTQSEAGVVARLKRAAGREEVVGAECLIGADGAHSRVRKEIGLDFSGETYPAALFVLDCKAEIEQIPHNEAYLAFSPDGLGGFFPLPNGRWRVIGRIPSDKKTITFEEIARDFPGQVQMKIRLSDPGWLSIYRAHHRYAAHFRKGRTFLLGDAAHIHSPVGGQGMNTGLQDAYNLAWKLAFVLQGKAGNRLLDTYHEERIHVARILVHTTDQVFHLMASQKRWVKWIRHRILPLYFKVMFFLFKKHREFRRGFFSLVSEIAIHYRFSRLSKKASKGFFPKSALKPGDRWPDFDPTRKGVRWHLYLPPGWDEVGEKCKAALHELVEIRTLPPSSRGYFLIRPDFYVACRGTDREGNFLKSYLARIFNI